MELRKYLQYTHEGSGLNCPGASSSENGSLLNCPGTSGSVAGSGLNCPGTFIYWIYVPHYNTGSQITRHNTLLEVPRQKHTIRRLQELTHLI